MKIIHDPRKTKEEKELAAKCFRCKCIFTFQKSEADNISIRKFLKIFPIKYYHVPCPSCGWSFYTKGWRPLFNDQICYDGL